MSSTINELSLNELVSQIDEIKAENSAIRILLTMVIHQLSNEQKSRVKLRAYEYNSLMDKNGDSETEKGSAIRLETLSKILDAVI
ncbi:hypothetical protein ABJA24_001160 [Providencia rettgeri]